MAAGGFADWERWGACPDVDHPSALAPKASAFARWPKKCG
jgi:hypothetical protein